MLWWMTTASSPSRTAMVTVSLVRSLSRSQTGLAQRRISSSDLTALASSTSPKPSLYFSVPASCSTSPRSLKVVSRRYAVDLWMSSSLETSVTPDHPWCDKNSITETARSTDCTEGLLRTTAHISADPTPPSVSWPDPSGASSLRAIAGLRIRLPVGERLARGYQNVLMSSALVKARGRPSDCCRALIGWLG